MKRKIFGIVFALALVLGFVLTTAVPVSANPGDGDVTVIVQDQGGNPITGATVNLGFFGSSNGTSYGMKWISSKTTDGTGTAAFTQAEIETFLTTSTTFVSTYQVYLQPGASYEGSSIGSVRTVGPNLVAPQYLDQAPAIPYNTPGATWAYKPAMTFSYNLVMFTLVPPVATWTGTDVTVKFSLAEPLIISPTSQTVYFDRTVHTGETPDYYLGSTTWKCPAWSTATISDYDISGTTTIASLGCIAGDETMSTVALGVSPAQSFSDPPAGVSDQYGNARGNYVNYYKFWNTTLVASPASLPPDGSSTSTVTATIKDATGAAVAGGKSIIFYTSLGSITSPRTTSGGEATATLTAASSSGIADVRAAGGQLNVPILPPPTEVWVDDAWAGLPNGTEVALPGGGTGYIGYDAFATIQDAIDAAVGSTVHVAAGTYDEQVVIDKSLTLQGAGESTIIKPSQATANAFQLFERKETGTDNDSAPIVIAKASGATVNIESLKIDGSLVSSVPAGATLFAGIMYRDTNGLIDQVTVQNISIANGNGMYLVGHDTAVSVEVSYCNVSGYLKNGITANFPNMTANIHDNTVTGMGPTTVIAQNGIQIGFGATSTVSTNTVSGHVWTGTYGGSNDPATDPDADGACGILLYLSGGTVEIATNTLTGNQFGIWTVGATGINVHNNDITGLAHTGNAFPTGIAIWDSDMWTVDPFGGTEVGTTAAINTNTFDSHDYGIIVLDYTAGGALPTATVTGNTFSNNNVQLTDDTGTLDIATILASNTFDLAVTVDHSGASLLHTIWSSIQDGIDAAVAGDTVNVAAGTYDEQVVITKSLTLEGAGDTTIVQPSSAAKLTQVFTIPWSTGTKEVAGIIVADGAAGVTVKDLKVDGENVTACPTGANWVAGVLYRETGGTIDNVSVEDMTIGDTGTAVRGQGILLSAVGASPISVEVMNSHLSNYDKNGITAIGNQLTANIHDNTVTGRGPTLDGDEVQNGIVVIHDAEATVNDNTISDHAYAPAVWGACGIMFCQASGSAEGNTLTDNQTGIAASILPADNGFGGPPYTWTVSMVGNTVDASGLTVPGGCGLYAESYVAGAALNVTMDGNQLTGGPASGIAIGGDENGTPAGDIVATITNNTISDWQEGIHLVSSMAAGSTITGNTIANNISGASGIHLEAAVDATNVSVNDNDIAGNGDYGVYNGGIGTLDATDNWWGNDSGPTHTGNPSGTGDEVSDLVDYEPWLVASVEKATEAATGKGPATFTVDNGTITGLTAVDEATLPLAGKPSGVTFPNGLFSFNITGIAPASTVTVTIILPSAAPVGTQYWKCQGGTWINCTTLLGDDNGDDVLTLTLTDGGLGDADGAANGTIVDPGGPGTPGGRGGGGGGGGGGAILPTVTGLVVVPPLELDPDGRIQATCHLKTTDGKLTLDITKGTKLLDSAGKPLKVLSAVREILPPSAPSGAVIIIAYNFGLNGATFSPPITLTINYDPATLPDDVAEEDLYIAYWDGSKWVALETTVDTMARAASCQVSHFTTFALIGSVTPPAPAAFSVSSLSIQPAEVQPNDVVNITLSVANTGETEGSYSVVLKINGAKEAEKSITLAPGKSQNVSFSVTKAEAGSYNVTVEGLSGSFNVVGAAAEEAPPAAGAPIAWWIWVIAGVVVAGIIIFFAVRRRA